MGDIDGTVKLALLVSLVKVPLLPVLPLNRLTKNLSENSLTAKFAKAKSRRQVFEKALCGSKLRETGIKIYKLGGLGAILGVLAVRFLIFGQRLNTMFKTREILIGPIFRFLIGILGILVIVTGLFLSAREFWFAFQGEWLRLLSASLLLIIMSGGVSLLVSAIRGRLSIRSPQLKNKI